MFESDDDPSVWGAVVGDDRGSLPFQLLHGESLVAAASWALGAVDGVLLVGAGVTDWSVLVESGLPLVLHDLACPMTPPEFIDDCIASSRESGRVVAGVRPVTDTIKQVHDGFVGETVDRDGLRALCSPVVLPPAAVATLDAWPRDLLSLVTSLADVSFAEAPPAARRVATPDDIRLLEALTARTGSPLNR